MLWLLATLAFAEPFSAPLVASDGSPSTLSTAADGQRVVVVVMKGAWCPVCVEQIDRLNSQSARLQRLETVVVGVSTDTPELNRKVELSTGAQTLRDPDHRWHPHRRGDEPRHW